MSLDTGFILTEPRECKGGLKDYRKDIIVRQNKYCKVNAGAYRSLTVSSKRYEKLYYQSFQIDTLSKKSAPSLNTTNFVLS